MCLCFMFDHWLVGKQNDKNNKKCLINKKIVEISFLHKVSHKIRNTKKKEEVDVE